MQRSLKQMLLAAATAVSALSSSAYVSAQTVYLGPGYNPSTTSGFDVPVSGKPLNQTPKIALQSGGLAIGFGPLYYASGGNLGSPAAVGYAWNPISSPAPTATLYGVSTDANGHSAATTPFAINIAGTIAGTATMLNSSGSSTGTVPVSWNQAGVLTQLQAPAGTGPTSNSTILPSASVTSINAGGSIVGGTNVYDQTTGAYLGADAMVWLNGSTTPTVLANPYTALQPYFAGTSGINTAGYIAGNYYAANSSGGFIGDRAVVWDPTGTIAQELPWIDNNVQGNIAGSQPGVRASAATMINDNGVVVGTSEDYDSSGNRLGLFPVRWLPAGGGTYTVQVLATVGVSNVVPTPRTLPTSSNVNMVNANGDAVGSSNNYNAAGNLLGTLPAQWRIGGTAQTQLTLLGTSATGTSAGQCFSINDAEYSVGTVNNYTTYASDNITSGTAVAVLWGPDGSLTDLNSFVTLVAANSTTPGWVTLTQGDDITDDGWILGYGTYDSGGSSPVDYRREFLISDPVAVPEPVSSMLLATVGGALGLRRRRRGLH